MTIIEKLSAVKSALEGSIKLIGGKVISNVMPCEQERNYEALKLIPAIEAALLEAQKGEK